MATGRPDTHIPCHIINLVHVSYRRVVVKFPDTDIFILLMYLVIQGLLEALITLEFHREKGHKFRRIDVERVRSLGVPKVQGLVGRHNFMGGDWGEKFSGVSNKRWITKYLKLGSDDPIIKAFLRLGKETLDATRAGLEGGEMPPERFVCTVYSPNGAQKFLKAHGSSSRGRPRSMACCHPLDPHCFLTFSEHSELLECYAQVLHNNPI